jgi:hypothetical protein
MARQVYAGYTRCALLPHICACSALILDRRFCNWPLERLIASCFKRKVVFTATRLNAYKNYSLGGLAGLETSFSIIGNDPGMQSSHCLASLFILLFVNLYFN